MSVPALSLSHEAAFHAGKAWRGQYVADFSLPPLARACPVDFLVGGFHSGTPPRLATNKQVLEEAQDLLFRMGVASHIKPFVNCECRFGLYGDVKQWAQISQFGDYQI
jgi:hypothetical protein